MEEAENDDVHGLPGLDLPPEIVLHIFGLMDPATVVLAERICRTWHDFAGSEEVWKVTKGGTNFSSQTNMINRQCIRGTLAGSYRNRLQLK
mgnify:CR=1 FL=1